MKIIRKILKYLIFGYKSSGKMYINHLKKLGAKIGNGSKIFDPITTVIDEMDPYLITIGKNFQCTGGVTILTHDYGWSVTKAVYGDVLGSIRPVDIGDNVYVGMNAIILPGVKIGNNVIIGAGSIVSKDIESNCVAVGNPCKKIYSIDEYHKKRLAVQEKEVIEIAKQYFDRFGIVPKKDVFREHFWCFTNKKDELTKHFIYQNNLINGSEIETWKNFIKHKPIFKSFDDMLKIAIENRSES